MVMPCCYSYSHLLFTLDSSYNAREKARNAVNIIEMNGQTTLIKDPENLSAEPRKFTFDYSYWSHDGFRELENGYLEPDDPKYSDQVC